MGYLHLPEARFVVMAPGKARSCLLPLQRLLYLLSCEEHLNVHKVLKTQRDKKIYIYITISRLTMKECSLFIIRNAEYCAIKTPK